MKILVSQLDGSQVFFCLTTHFWAGYSSVCTVTSKWRLSRLFLEPCSVRLKSRLRLWRRTSGLWRVTVRILLMRCWRLLCFQATHLLSRFWQMHAEFWHKRLVIHRRKVIKEITNGNVMIILLRSVRVLLKLRAPFTMRSAPKSCRIATLRVGLSLGCRELELHPR